MQLAGVYARASALFAFTVLVFLILAETPFRVALIATGLIFSQTIAGMALYNSRDRDRKFDLTSSVALGFATLTGQQELRLFQEGVECGRKCAAF